jgi:hypothetical protein
MRCSPAEFRALPLEIHALLADVPLRDVSAIDLPGGGPERTIADVRALLPQGRAGQLGGPLVRVLFGLRHALGRLFGWDRALADDGSWSYANRLSADLVGRSAAPAGEADGFFRTLYLLPRELAVEARNATVHAFLVSALRPMADGYRLYWAVYVKRVSWLTPVYMAVIEPFRRFIVYPSLLRQVRARWVARYSAPAA